MLHRVVPMKDLALKMDGWVNPRFYTGLDKQSLIEFGGELKTRGIKVPLKVQRVKTAEGVINLVIDGQRRILSLKAVGMPTDTEINVMDHTDEVMDPTAENFARLQLDALAMYKREGLSSWELIENAKDLQAKGKSVKAIGAAIGRDPTWVSRFLTAMADADVDLIQRWKTGELSDELFKDLSNAPPAEQKEKADEVIALRKTNHKSEARAVAKEAAAIGKAKKHDTTTARGGRPLGAKAPAKADDPVKLPKAMIAELAKLLKGKPLGNDYLKGIRDCALYANGELALHQFGKAWERFSVRLEGALAEQSKKPTAKKDPRKTVPKNKRKKAN